VARDQLGNFADARFQAIDEAMLAKRALHALAHRFPCRLADARMDAAIGDDRLLDPLHRGVGKRSPDIRVVGQKMPPRP
jgi:hypothetical protein